MPLTVLSGMPTGVSEEYQDMAFKCGNPQIYNMPTPASYAAAASTTYLSTDILGFMILDAGNGASAHTATLPTAALLAAAIRGIFSSRGVIVGDSLFFVIANTSSGAGAFTVAAGSGGTFDTHAAQTIAQNTSREFMIRFTNGTPGSEAYSIYG